MDLSNAFEDHGLYFWSPEPAERVDNGSYSQQRVRDRARRMHRKRGERRNLGEALKQKATAATEHQVQGCRLACRYFSMLEKRRS